MADYKDIIGTAVRNNAGTLTGAKTGELFYDSTALDFIYRHPNVTSAGAWRTGNDLNTGRNRISGAGTYTATLAFFGESPPGVTALNESYDGTSWTELADGNTVRKGLAGSGTTTSALAFGGNAPSPDDDTGKTESWNGSSWTEVGDLNTQRRELGGCGSSNTAALAFGGKAEPG